MGHDFGTESLKSTDSQRSELKSRFSDAVEPFAVSLVYLDTIDELVLIIDDQALILLITIYLSILKLFFFFPLCTISIATEPVVLIAECL